jgi:sulfur carrier protein
VTIRISLNNDVVELPDACTIAQALQQQGYSCDRHAVAVNTSFVPRSQHGDFVLSAGDRVDVLAPVQGG